MFAIAITLPVIGGHVPDVPHGSSDAVLCAALVHLITNLVGYFVNFGVIEPSWTSHRRAFSLAARYSAWIVGTNPMLLGCIAFMPFFTAFMSEYQGSRVRASLDRDRWCWRRASMCASARWP